MISAEVICDSVNNNEQGNRLTTFKLRYPKFIHGEAKTHRVLRVGNEGGYFVLEQEVGLMDDPNLSRNASSSRAIPTAKLIEEVRSDALRAGPVWFGKNQKGMQAAEELTGRFDCLNGWWNSFCHLEGATIQEAWKEAATIAADIAEAMTEAGAHKQIVNRLLEPFSHINVIATATEWQNFFGLRLSKDAQPEMRALAIAMWEARKASTPKLLKPGEWHLPFITKDELQDIDDRLGFYDIAIKVSAARCARVSYESFETGKRSTVESDLKLCDQLSASGHWSPFEHQATPDELTKHEGKLHLTNRRTHAGFDAVQYWDWEHQNEHGNLVGWRQNRKLIPNEAVAPLPEEYR